MIENEGLPTSFFYLGKILEKTGDSPVRNHTVFRNLIRLTLGIPGLINAISQIKFQTKQFSPDFIIANGFKAHFLTSLAIKKKIPIIWYFQDFLSNRKLVSKLLPCLVRSNTFLIADSKAVAKDLRLFFVNNKQFIWENTVDTSLFTPLLSSKKSVIKASGKCLKVGLVATFARWKGHETFLRAAKKVKEQFPYPIIFLVVGGPVYKSDESQWSMLELEKIAEVEGVRDIVEFTGFYNNMVDIYRELDIVVHASTAPEPFGQVIIESMACSKPVVVAAHGGASEIGKPGHDLIHHVPGNCNSLAKAILELLYDEKLRKRIGVAARDTATKLYDISKVDERWFKIFSELEINC